MMVLNLIKVLKIHFISQIIMILCFISNKTYCLILDDDRNTVVIKVKGVTKTKDKIANSILEYLK